MDKNNLKDAYDIGENMAVFSGEGRSYTIINKETGKTRQLVSEDGSLLVTDNDIDFDAIYKGCPDFRRAERGTHPLRQILRRTPQTVPRIPASTAGSAERRSWHRTRGLAGRRRGRDHTMCRTGKCFRRWGTSRRT